MIVILTGGSAGIGKATAELLMSRGDTVYSLSRRGGEDVSDSKSGGSIVNIKADVTKPETLQAAVAEESADTWAAGIRAADNDFPVRYSEPLRLRY